MCDAQVATWPYNGQHAEVCQLQIQYAPVAKQIKAGSISRLVPTADAFSSVGNAERYALSFNA
jgi:hypothetical protein